MDRTFGSVLAADARANDGRVALRKGIVLGQEHRVALLSIAGSELHLVDLDDGELPQDEVARRLARVLAGPGATAGEPQQGQARLRSTWRGFLRVRSEAVRAINELRPLLCFTLPNGHIVLEGDEVAGAKSAALATPEPVVAAAEAVARAAATIAVHPFAPRRVAALMTERLEPKARGLVAAAVRGKIAWYGSELVELSEIPHRPEAAARQFKAAVAAGADLLLVSGANSLDPLDPVFEGLTVLGGEVLRRGVPAHPGSMVWAGRLGATPVLGIATCSGFGKNTAFDLLLARVLAGEDPRDAADDLGHGGLLEGAAQRFPPYERGVRLTMREPAETTLR